MIQDIITSNNSIKLLATEQSDVDKFIKISTVLDKNKAAKALFSHDVTIEYNHDKDLNIIELIKLQRFSYNEVNNLINHMQYHKTHSIEIKPRKVSTILTKSWKKLVAKDMTFCIFRNKPQFSISICNNSIILSPITEKYINLFSEDSNQLLSLLKKDNSLYNCIIDKGQNSIRVVLITEIHKTISALVEVFLKLKIIEDEDKQLMFDQLIRLAFKDFTAHELKIVKNIVQFSNQYKEIAKDVENIFSHLAYDENFDLRCIDKLKQALNNEGVFSVAPEIIKRSFYRLNKNFHSEIENIINNTKH